MKDRGWYLWLQSCSEECEGRVVAESWGHSAVKGNDDMQPHTHKVAILVEH